MNAKAFIGAIALGATMVAAGPVSAHSAKIKTMTSDEFGTYLTDSKGIALYNFEADRKGGGSSACDSSCLAVWPPYLAGDRKPHAGPGVDKSRIGTITRADGRRQVTYGGWPLYYYKSDKKPGQTRGQDVDSYGDDWYLVAPSGKIIEGKSDEESGMGNQTQSSSAEY